MQPPQNAASSKCTLLWWPIKTLSTLLGQNHPFRRVTFWTCFWGIFPNPPHPQSNSSTNIWWNICNCREPLLFIGGEGTHPPIQVTWWRRGSKYSSFSMLLLWTVTRTLPPPFPSRWKTKPYQKTFHRSYGGFWVWCHCSYLNHPINLLKPTYCTVWRFSDLMVPPSLAAQCD